MQAEIRFSGSLQEFRKFLADLIIKEARLRAAIALAHFNNR